MLTVLVSVQEIIYLSRAIMTPSLQSLTASSAAALLLLWLCCYSSFFKVDELLKIVQSENISTPIYVGCDKMYQFKVCVQEFWYCLPGLDIPPELSKIDNSARKKAVEGCETLQVI